MHQVCILSVRSQPTATTSETVSEFEVYGDSIGAAALVAHSWYQMD